MQMVEEGKNQPKIATKRMKFKEIKAEEEEGGEDRISLLPDCLLAEILSRLPSTKEAIRTGTLSSRWKHIWVSVPVLIFRYSDRKWPYSYDFVSLVDKTLTQCRQLKLKRFELDATNCDPSPINRWTRYAIRCNVEELNLKFWGMEDGDEIRLDQFFCISSSFTDLKLRGCIWNPNGAISWKSLTSLRITKGEFDEDLFQNILSWSPLLETLVLDCCRGPGRLDFTSKSVKKFVLSNYHEFDFYGSDPDDIVEINAPNILSLTIEGLLGAWNLLLLNVSSLIEADLDYENLNDWKRWRREEMLKRCILNLSHVKELRIGYWCSKDLFRLKAKGFVVPSNVKCPGLAYNWSESDCECECECEGLFDSCRLGLLQTESNESEGENESG